MENLRSYGSNRETIESVLKEEESMVRKLSGKGRFQGDSETGGGLWMRRGDSTEAVGVTEAGRGGLVGEQGSWSETGSCFQRLSEKHIERNNQTFTEMM